MYGLDLFSGIGGITKALEGYVTPIAYCENDRYAQAVLLSRMVARELPNAPIYDDVKTLKGANLHHVDIIYGGFPCQDISVAGKQKGLEGKRSGLFSEICRLAVETEAEWVFLENVPNIRSKGLGRVLKHLDKCGYDCRWGVLSASDVGSPQNRERWFLLAHSRKEPNPQENTCISTLGEEGDSRHNDSRCDGKSLSRNDWWISEPKMGRMVDGVQCRVDRLGTLGNAVVPAQAREAFERLMGLKECS